MRTEYIKSGIVAVVLTLAITLAGAQSSATSPSPQAAPPQANPQTAPQQTPQAAPPAAEQQSPSQSSPSQAPSSQSGSASQSSQAQEDNPLSLTDEQKTKLRPIIADENQQLEAVRNDSSMTPEQKVSKANQIKETAAPKIKAILTPEQLQKLAELQQKARQQSAPQNESQKPQN